MAKFDVLIVRRTKYGTAHTGRVKPYSSALRDESVVECESLDRQIEEMITPPVTPSRTQTEHELVRRFVYDLGDVELILWLKQYPRDALNAWEKEFASGVVAFYDEKRRISWKQRKHVREIIENRFRDVVLAKVTGSISS